MERSTCAIKSEEEHERQEKRPAEYLLKGEKLQKKLETLEAIRICGRNLEIDMVNVDDVYTERARIELRETPEVVAEALEAFRKMLKDDENLHTPDDAEFCMKFLRPCKWYPTSAFHLMQRYYHFRENYASIVDGTTPMNMRKGISSELLVPLPLRCINGCKLLLIHGGAKWKPKEYSLNEMFQCTMIILEAALMEPTTQVAGVQTIIDMEGLPLSYVTYFTPKFAAMVVEWVQKCLPCRLKNIHIINQPFIFNMVFAFFKPFLSEKIRKRIHFHGTNRQNLLACIGPKALPKSYGGELDDSEEPFGEKLADYFCKWQKEFEEMKKYGYTREKK